MGMFTKLLGPALSLGANFLVPGSGAAVGALTSGLLSGKSNKKTISGIQQMDDQKYDKYLMNARPNYEDASGGTSSWTNDPATGRPMQKMAFGPEEQKRRDFYNQAAGNRAQIGAGMDLSAFSRGPTFDKNDRLQQALTNAGPRQPNAPMSPYQLTPKPVAPVAPAAAPTAPGGIASGGIPAAANQSTSLEGLSPQDIQQLLMLLRGSRLEAGGGNGGGGGGGGDDGTGGE